MTSSPPVLSSRKLALSLVSIAIPLSAQMPVITATRDADNLAVSWTGTGALQSAESVTGPWLDLVELGHPVTLPLTNRPPKQFLRVIERWSRRADLIEANSEMSVAQLDDTIYVLGGYPSSRVTVGTVQVYNAAEDRWSLTKPIPVPVNHSMAAALDGKLYLIGGQTTASGSTYVNNVVEYDPATTNWTPRAPMPTARSGGGAAVIGDLIYVAGGRPPQGQDFAVYHPGSNVWAALPNMPTARNHLAVTAMDGKVYVAGGRFGSGFGSEFTDVLEVYDPATRQWSTLSPMPTARSGVNGIAVNGLFHVFGGESSAGVFPQHEAYDPGRDRWYRLEPLPVPIHGVTGAACIDGWIHLPGGGTSTGGSSGSRIHQVYRANLNLP